MTNLGKVQTIVFLLAVLVAQCAARNAACAQARPVSSKQSEATPRIPTKSYNQRLEGLARDRGDSESASAASDYRIGADDLLEITVYGATDLDRTVRVSANGWISLPLAGDVHAEGLTARGLEGELEGLLAKKYMTHPEVSVFLKETQSHAVSVFGSVQKPGVFQIQEPKSLIEVLSMAQGLADDAGDRVIVIRHSSVGEPTSADRAALGSANGASFSAVAAESTQAMNKTGDDADGLQINLKDLLVSANSRYNVVVYPGDVVKVPPAGIVYVVGEVRRPGGFLLKTDQNLSVLQALALAAGTTGTSAGKSARIIRTEEKSGNRQEIPINLNRILAGKAPDLVLQSKDILFVPNSATKTAFYRGAEAAVSITGGLIVYRW